MNTSLSPYTLRARIDDDKGRLIRVTDSESESASITVDATGSKVRITLNLDGVVNKPDIRTRAFLSPKKAEELGRMLQEYAQIAADNKEISPEDGI